MAIGGPLLEKLWHTAMISLKFPHRELPGLCLYYDFLPEAATSSYFFLLFIYKYLFQKQRKQCFPLSSLLNRVREEANRPCPFLEKIQARNHSRKDYCLKRNRNNVFSQITWFNGKIKNNLLNKTLYKFLLCQYIWLYHRYRIIFKIFEI